MILDEALKECMDRYPYGIKFRPLINRDKYPNKILESSGHLYKDSVDKRISCKTTDAGSWTVWDSLLGFAQLEIPIEIKDIPQSIKDML